MAFTPVVNFKSAPIHYIHSNRYLRGIPHRVISCCERLRRHRQRMVTYSSSLAVRVGGDAKAFSFKIAFVACGFAAVPFEKS